MGVAHRFHVHEHVLAARRIGTVDEAIALYSVEPFDLHRLELSGRVGKRLAVGPFARWNGRTRRGLQAGAEVDRQDFLGLKPALEPHRDAFDRRALGQAPPSVLAKHAEVQQHVAVDLVADDKAEATRRVEPFHPARDRPQFGSGGVVFGFHFHVRLIAGKGRTNPLHGYLLT